MNVLVTGASGFIGQRVVAELIRSGLEVHGIARGEQPDEAAGAAWHRIDLFDAPAVASLIAAVRPSHLIHLAWEARPGIFPNAPENLDWVGASLHLLRCFVECGGTSFVAAGSCFEMMDTTLYGRAKAAFRSVAERYCSDRNVRFTSGRIFFPYGVGEPPDKFVSMLFRRLRSGEAVELREGERRLDFIHVTDVARAFAAINSSDARGIVDVGTGARQAVRSIAERVASIIGRDPSTSFTFVGSSSADPDLIADTDQLLALGWAPTTSLEDGLRRY